MNEAIRISDEGGGVRRITIDRAEKRNALTRPMMQALCDAVTEAEAADGVRVLLFDSPGPIFCAGADLDGLSGEPLTPQTDPGHQFLMALARARKPLVAAVQGPAVGVGATMLLQFDLIYAAPAMRLRMPFIDLGLTPEGGATVLMPQLLGLRGAARMLMLGEDMDAGQALASGMINEIVEADQLAARAEAAAHTLASKPPVALARTKGMLRSPALLTAMDAEQAVFQEMIRGPEFQAAVAAAKARIAKRGNP